jgi:hypothetical protein
VASTYPRCTMMSGCGKKVFYRIIRPARRAGTDQQQGDL